MRNRNVLIVGSPTAVSAMAMATVILEQLGHERVIVVQGGQTVPPSMPEPVFEFEPPPMKHEPIVSRDERTYPKIPDRRIYSRKHRNRRVK